jgi:hypothetical protein
MVLVPPLVMFVNFSLREGITFKHGEPSQFVIPRMLFLGFFLNMLAGMVAGDLVRSVVTRPFSTCLPGYKKVPVFMIAIMALIVNALYSLLVILGTGELFYSTAFIFSIGVFIYVNIAIIVVKSINPSAFFGFFGFMGFYGIIAGVPLQETVFNFLEANSLLISSALLSICVWRLKRFDNVRIAEQMCNVPTMDLFSMWNTEKAKRVAEYRIAKRDGSYSFGAAAIFEKIMNRCSSRSMRHGFGLAMSGFGINSMNMKMMLFMWLLLLTLICYIPSVGGTAARVMFFAVPMFSVVQLANAARVPLLLDCGRKERFEGATIAGIVYMSAVTAALFVMVLLTVFMGRFMPSFVIPFDKGILMQFNPMKFRYLLIGLFTMPVVYVFSIKSVKFGAIVSIVMIYFIIGLIIADNVVRSMYGATFARYPILIALPLVLICGFSYIVIRHHFLKTDFKCASS